MKKDSPSKFIVVIMAPGLRTDELSATVTYIQDGMKPLLMISGQSAPREPDADLPTYAYNLFQQYVLLPENTLPRTFTSKMQEGLFICSFRKETP